MKIKPLGDRVIAERLDQEEKTKGGIIIPDSAQEKPQEGRVLAVGAGKRLKDGTLQKLDVKKGDKILFGKYAGVELKIGGEDRLILNESEILGVLED